MKNIKNDCGGTKTDIDTIKKEIQTLAKEKSKCYRSDFSKKEDIELFLVKKILQSKMFKQI